MNSRSKSKTMNVPEYLEMALSLNGLKALSAWKDTSGHSKSFVRGGVEQQLKTAAQSSFM